ncbi:phosphoglycerate dehydrogenase [Enterococcus sp. AZ072]|uniref:phosphoglycerate dehydrogenase n=1 Tax=unclassified Enterococcus TaxID=2608891 RepID=UPI003D2D7A2E
MGKVLVTSNSFGKFSKEPIEWLEKEGMEVCLNSYGRQMEEQELIQALTDVEALILSTEKITKNVLDNCPKLKVISRYGVGLDNVDLDYCRNKGVIVSVTSGANSNAVAEYTVTSMLAALKGLCYSANEAKKGQWTKLMGLDLAEKTVGVIGLGAIGKTVIQRLSGFDLNILGFDQYYDEEFCEKFQVKKASLNEIFETADVITFHIPSNSTTPILSRDNFEKLKKDVVIINTARASLIDYEALYDYLKCGKVFAAALDVHSDEPTFDKKLMELDNVILTPHNGALSKEAINRTSMAAVKNLLKALK